MKMNNKIPAEVKEWRATAALKEDYAKSVCREIQELRQAVRQLSERKH